MFVTAIAFAGERGIAMESIYERDIKGINNCDMTRTCVGCFCLQTCYDEYVQSKITPEEVKEFYGQQQQAGVEERFP